ncbi:flagellar hook-associated protein FlgK [Bacillus sp. 3255]|uniref:flagellar hook-associated protein FlgK n=1 Tax=Bacillus sp. 3255 TaxID=2817904 RepID=UPI002854DF79|nr:flagellar hook-associated protein FlgK [Bacillus sp. 3255]MDR6883482.1 flagellar hook-associated protein 1 FlgK [Bacillus sp. 3255]
MRSSFMGLETAKRSLFTQQAALQTTGHNIANANTEGYSRQVVNMTASQSLEPLSLYRSTIPGQMGTGVEFSSITRIREKFLDEQFRNENKSLGNATIQADTLDKLEAIVTEPSDTGLQAVLSKFWSSWSDFSKDPNNVTGRKIVKENAMALGDALNYTSTKLSELSSDLSKNISVKAEEMNSMTSNIAKLNAEIQRVEGLGDDANDLRDQRDLLTDKLSKIVNISVQDTPEGYTINMGATNLVTGATSATLTADILNSSVPGSLTDGEVYGMIISRDQYVKDYQNQLDVLANTIANGDVTVTIPSGSVLPDGTVLNGVSYSDANGNRTLTSDLTVTVKGLNGLQKLGYNLNTPAGTGVEFFTAKDGSGTITAANFQVNPIIQNDPTRIASSMAVSGTPPKAIQGNNALALLTSQLKDSAFTFVDANGTSTKATVNDYFSAVVGQLGIESSDAQRQLTNQQALVDQVDSRKLSVSGVSLDEEMSNMIKFQHAYSAAARVMTTFDEMLDKLINGMGTVGR